ncbi:MAG: Signal recognition particle core component [Alyxoria varia]|nr:MAG: Signal recognition particle core component [Alyxoria varia]
MAGTQSLSSLLQQTTLDDHEEILKAANSALKKSKTDLQAEHARVVAFLKLDRWDDAFRAFSDAGDALKKQARVEWAYTLYKTERFAEAQKFAGEAKAQDYSLAHVEAQAAYRAENFARAVELYGKLSAQGQEDEENDLRINSGATDAQLFWARQNGLVRKPKPGREDLEQFETAFNAACGYLGRGELKQAQLLLQRATSLCNAADELSEKEKKQELIPIQLQRILVLHRLSKLEEAERLCSEIDLTETSDLTKHIAQATKLAISNGSANPYLSQRFLSSSATTSAKPCWYQKAALQRNEVTLDLQANKLRPTSQAVDGHTSDLDNEYQKVWLGVAKATAQLKSQSSFEATEALANALRQRPNDLGTLLTLVQLYLKNGNTNAAAAALESVSSTLDKSSAASDVAIWNNPAFIATTVAVYAQQNRPSKGREALTNSASYWQSKSANIQTNLLKAAGAALTESTNLVDSEKAHKIFNLVHAQDTSDLAAIAGIVTSSEKGSNDADMVDRLPSVEQLTTDVNVSTLEEAGVAKLKPRAQAAGAGTKRAADTQPKPSKAKRVRKSRLPKDYDPEKKPDPERWLPMKDRSYWRPKGKKKKAAGHAATQGGMASEDNRPGTPIQQQNKGGAAASKSQKKKGKGK